MGEGPNQDKPTYTITENTVEVKFPKESIIFDPKELEKYNL